MKIVVYTTSDQSEALRLMEKSVKEKLPDFSWTITTDLEEFKATVGAFKIFATSKPCDFDVDLRWSDPSYFLKKAKKKASVWEDIVTKVLPALRKKTIGRKQLSITDTQLQQILSMMTSSSAQFFISHPDGYSIGVNIEAGADVYLTSSDLSSMIAASWLFGAREVRLHQA